MTRFLMFAAVCFSLAGCGSRQDSPPHGGFGWSPPPKEEDRQQVYGDSAPEYPTMSDLIEREQDRPAK